MQACKISPGTVVVGILTRNLLRITAKSQCFFQATIKELLVNQIWCFDSGLKWWVFQNIFLFGEILKDFSFDKIIVVWDSHYKSERIIFYRSDSHSVCVDLTVSEIMRMIWNWLNIIFLQRTLLAHVGTHFLLDFLHFNHYCTEVY